jgi:hypothetical protein
LFGVIRKSLCSIDLAPHRSDSAFGGESPGQPIRLRGFFGQPSGFVCGREDQIEVSNLDRGMGLHIECLGKQCESALSPESFGGGLEKAEGVFELPQGTCSHTEQPQDIGVIGCLSSSPSEGLDHFLSPLAWRHRGEHDQKARVVAHI